MRENNALDLVAKQSSSFFDKKLLLDATVGWHHQLDSILPSDGSGLDTGEGPQPAARLLAAHAPGIRQPQRGLPRLPHITEFESLPDPSVCDAGGAPQQAPRAAR